MEAENPLTPYGKFEEFEQLLQTEKTQKTVAKAPPNKFTQAMSQLNESAIPKNIPCRQNEKREILKFLEEGIQSLGSKSTLYISGVPGIGKTITVMQVLESLRDVKDTVQISINAMVLSRPDKVYGNILHKLTGVREKNPTKALIFIDEIFKTGLLPLKMTPRSKGDGKSLQQKISRTKIIFLDEIDYLYSRNEEVLYNLFEWTQYTYSKIVLIGISNTIDLPERLQDKILSRIGESRLVFRPYSYDQIEIIMKQRIQSTGVFDDEAVNYACKKVARFSCDIRKCLQVLITAIEIYLKSKKSLTGKISLEVIAQAHERIYEDPIVKQLSFLPLIWKKILLKICSRIRKTGKYCWYSELEVLMSTLTDQNTNYKITLKKLEEMNFIRMKLLQRNKDNRTNKDIKIPNYIKEPYIELNVQIDQVTNAFRNEESMLFELGTLE